ncbi:MAG TPA: hypothetical protein ENH23_06155 [candidate division Zixibacteria bacterium]|nr:hypothetical protein [candidate division Zixibacteria bacterium]
MSDEEYKLLLDSMSDQILGEKETADSEKKSEILRKLMKETIKFRDKLKEDNSYVLTVEDTRKALEALELHLQNEKFPKDLTPEQKALAQILIDTVVLYNYGF